MKAAQEVNKRRFQDANIWLEIISLPMEDQKTIRLLANPEFDKLKMLPGSCCNQDSEWIRQDYYEQIK